MISSTAIISLGRYGFIGRSDVISNKSEGREKKERDRGEVTLLLLHLLYRRERDC